MQHQQPQQQPPQQPLPPNVDLSLINASAEIETSNTGSDSLAKLEKDRIFKDGVRGESYRTHIHRIVVAGMYVVGFIMIVLILIRAYHLVAPTDLRWLSEEDAHGLERIIFSGIILSFATKYFKKYKVVDD